MDGDERKRKTVPLAHVRAISEHYSDPAYPLSPAAKLLIEGIPDDAPAEELYDREQMRSQDIQFQMIRGLLEKVDFLIEKDALLDGERSRLRDGHYTIEREKLPDRVKRLEVGNLWKNPAIIFTLIGTIASGLAWAHFSLK